MSTRHHPNEHELAEKEYRIQTLTRYTGCGPDAFHSKVILTNFSKYLDHFAKSRGNLPIIEGSFFRVVHSPKEDISMVDIKIGSSAAALAVDLLSVCDKIHASVFLGMCGGLRRPGRYKIGDYLVPVASIRDERTSDSYMPPAVPALGNFLMQRAVAQVLEREKVPHHIGITYTANRRIWEFDEAFKNYLKETKAQGYELECATLFITSYRRKFTLGALLLISDLPLERVKTVETAKKVYEDHMAEHIELGVKIVEEGRQMESFRVKGAYQRYETDLSKS